MGQDDAYSPLVCAIVVVPGKGHGLRRVGGGRSGCGAAGPSRGRNAMTLPPHFFPIVIIFGLVAIFLEVGFTVVVLLNLHIQNRETVKVSQELARAAHANERHYLDIMQGLVMALNAIGKGGADDTK
jgi:hypothetical protein